jgi:hypothetical protein
VQLRYRRTPPLLLAVYIVASGGIALLLLLLEKIFHDPVVEVDGSGMTTRRGRRFSWTDLREARVNVDYGRRSRPSSMPLSWSARFKFDGGTRVFLPLVCENGFDALALMEKALDRSFGRPTMRKDFRGPTSWQVDKQPASRRADG